MLDLSQTCHIPHGVEPVAATGPTWRHQTQAIVLPQSLCGSPES